MFGYCPMKPRKGVNLEHYTVHPSGKNTKEDNVGSSLQTQFTDLENKAYLDRAYHYNLISKPEPTPS